MRGADVARVARSHPPPPLVAHLYAPYVRRRELRQHTLDDDCRASMAMTAISRYRSKACAPVNRAQAHRHAASPSSASLTSSARPLAGVARSAEIRRGRTPRYMSISRPSAGMSGGLGGRGIGVVNRRPAA